MNYEKMIEEIIDKVDLLTSLKIQYLQMFNDKENNVFKIKEIEYNRDLFIKNLKEEGITQGAKDQTDIYCEEILELYSKFMNNFVGNEIIDKEECSQRVKVLKLKLDKFREELKSFNVSVG